VTGDCADACLLPSPINVPLMSLSPRIALQTGTIAAPVHEDVKLRHISPLNMLEETVH